MKWAQYSAVFFYYCRRCCLHQIKSHLEYCFICREFSKWVKTHNTLISHSHKTSFDAEIVAITTILYSKHMKSQNSQIFQCFSAIQIVNWFILTRAGAGAHAWESNNINKEYFFAVCVRIVEMTLNRGEQKKFLRKNGRTKF